MGRALPLHEPCGPHGIGELDDVDVFVCAITRRWGHDAAGSVVAVDELGCGRRFPLCRPHGLRGCITCHAREEAAGVRGRVRALVVATWRGQQLAHVDARTFLEEVEHATLERLRGIVAAIAAGLPSTSMLGRAARVVALELAPRALGAPAAEAARVESGAIAMGRAG